MAETIYAASETAALGRPRATSAYRSEARAKVVSPRSAAAPQ